MVQSPELQKLGLEAHASDAVTQWVGHQGQRSRSAVPPPQPMIFTPLISAHPLDFPAWVEELGRSGSE